MVQNCLEFLNSLTIFKFFALVCQLYKTVDICQNKNKNLSFKKSVDIY